MTLKEKKALLKELLIKESFQKDPPSIDTFRLSRGRGEEEILEFNQWRNHMLEHHCYMSEVVRDESVKPEITITRQTGEFFKVINFSNYNYLGYATHPDVIKGAADALNRYGLGATASPLAGGLLKIHQELEESLLELFKIEGKGITLFTSGFGALVGVISAYIHRGDHIVVDSSAHASILDGALLSQGTLHVFPHNDIKGLEAILKSIDNGTSRILICTEGVFSADGDYGNLIGIVQLAKKYGAKTLVDEAHSILTAGSTGRGACEELGVLDKVDMVVGTFSKGFSGVGGFLYANKNLTNYVNFYARNRMFSCALDPAVTGGMIAATKLSMSQEGQERRQRLWDNGNYFRALLKDAIDFGMSTTWIVPVMYYDESITMQLIDYLEQNGFEGSPMVFPAVPKHQARIRIFISSEHTKPQLKRAADILIQAAEKFGFLKSSMVGKI